MPRKITRLGHPILRFPAEAVEVERLSAGEMDPLVNELRSALRELGARVLTAPQLGSELQILAYRTDPPDGDEGDSDIGIIVNPMLEPEHGDLVYDWEGCLSIPDLKGLVPRYPTIRIRGLDQSGEAVDFVAKGDVARILQHAHDHLSGVVFLDRMGDLRSLAFGEEWREFLSESDLEGDEAASSE